MSRTSFLAAWDKATLYACPPLASWQGRLQKSGPNGRRTCGIVEGVAQVSGATFFHNPSYVIQRVGLTCNDVMPEQDGLQLNLFEDAAKQVRGKALQEAMLNIRARFGKNAILRGMNYAPAATGRERNKQIGGHKSGI